MLNLQDQNAFGYTSRSEIINGGINISTATGPSHLGSLIDAVGEREFEVELLSFLNQTCGAEHCAVFCIDDGIPKRFGAASLDGSNTAHTNATLYLQKEFWRRDPTMDTAREEIGLTHLSIIRRSIGSFEDRELREQVYAHMGERLLICGPSASGRIALSVLKSGRDELFETDGVMELQRFASLLLPIVAKHMNATWQRRDILAALTSLHDIEGCIMNADEKFPRREAQVCARIIYGMFSAGIALELGISEETVTTYRKRLYQRLGIATQRELLLWYIAQWTQGHTGSTSLGVERSFQNGSATMPSLVGKHASSSH